MKKPNRKITAITGAALLGVALLAFPALANTDEQGTSWFNQMQSHMKGFMGENFNPGKHEELMNSPVMNEIHNSPEMQEAMTTGDFNQMQEFMNSNEDLKELIGEDALKQMNEFMDSETFETMHQDFENMNSMHDSMHGPGNNGMFQNSNTRGMM